ncbi:MAG: chromophore lyase CpcT/CpeT [Cyclobacteriaceae bacterium]|nr:chromophore lyase CpcT/CpeT [Cyclobacteriaceae bacterium]UYN87352.1 MAG: chromophore lyase CpcT/CpeT [Cyclobacteriaceae bacterium]
MKIIPATVLLSICSFALKAQSKKDLTELHSWMVGQFSSAEQAQRDSNFFDIRLGVYPIWKERTDGYWLYVEQASASSLDKPYRQRIYQLTLTNRGIESIIYTFDNPLEFAGQPHKVEALQRDKLTTRQGCEVVLKRKDKKTFVGGTVGKNCGSELRGASYATSEAVISSEGMTTLDMGFNANDEQVWGSTHGGYQFRKLVR